MAYKVEALEFYQMKKQKVWVSNPYMSNGLSVYEIENRLTEEEKLVFIDEMKEGLGTYVFNLLKKWESEKDGLPQDKYGKPKTVSKKAWIKRNDPHGVINVEYSLGTYYLFKTKFLQLSTMCPSTEYGYSLEYTGKSVVHQWFHDLCKELYYQEKKYFEEHDTKEMKLAHVRKLGDRYGIVFDSQLLNDIVWNREKDVTEAELDRFINAYEELEQKIKEIAVTLETVTK